MPKKIVLNVRISSNSAGLILQAVGKLDGVYSVDLDGETMTICGDIDPVLIRKQLRELGKNASIISVDQIDPKATEEEQVERNTRPSSLEDDPHLDIEDEQDVRNRKSPSASGDEERSSSEWVSVDPNLEVPDTKSSMQGMVSKNQTRNRWSRLWNVTSANVKAFLGRGKGKLSSHSQVKLEDPTSRTMALSLPQPERASQMREEESKQTGSAENRGMKSTFLEPMVPKFGEWDEPGRSRADQIYTCDEVREERQTGSTEYGGRKPTFLKSKSEGGWLVPKFGEWDAEQSRADDFIHFFDKLREEKQIGSAEYKGTETTSLRTTPERAATAPQWMPIRRNNPHWRRSFQSLRRSRMREEKSKQTAYSQEKGKSSALGGDDERGMGNSSLMSLGGDDERGVGNWRLPSLRHLDRIAHGSEEAQREGLSGSTNKKNSVVLGGDDERGVGNWSLLSLGGDDERGIGNWRLPSLSGDDKRRLEGLDSDIHECKVEEQELKMEEQKQGCPSSSRDKGKLVAAPDGDAERGIGNLRLSSLSSDDKQRLKNLSLNIHDSNKEEEKQSSFSSSNQGKSVALGGDDERGVGNWKMSSPRRDSDTENDMNE